MSQIKKLAGQTAYYGISSILGRVLNFLLLPLYTGHLERSEYGTVTYLYASIAILNIIYTYGLETGYFRFSTKNKNIAAYHYTSSAILVTSILLSGIMILLAPWLSDTLGNCTRPEYITYLSLIVFIDAVVAIPFAKLRLDGRPLKFAAIRLTVIAITILLNIIFLVVFPDIMAGKYLVGLQNLVDGLYDPSIGVGYIFIANLMANALYLPLLYKEFLQVRLRFNWQAFQPILAYAFPIFLMGLAGIFNERGYALIMPNLFPETAEMAGTGALGTFEGAFKLSVIMMLGIQAFRYAGEPFFFAHAEDKEAPGLFARIMHYFVVFNIVIMVGVALNIELIADIFLRRPQYKEALYVLPILLLAKLFYGVYVNLSVWFKVKDQTRYGTYFAGAGAIVTLLGNVLLIPYIGFVGAALSALACYLIMCLLCYSKGRKVFRIPYRFKPLLLYLLLALIFMYAVPYLKTGSDWVNYGIGLGTSLLFVGFMYWAEGRNFKYKSKEPMV